MSAGGRLLVVGLALASGVAASLPMLHTDAVTRDQTVGIAVTIKHSRFLPSVIEVPAHSRVRFTIVNDDPIAHEFLIGDGVVQAAHEHGTERAHGDRPGEVSVAPFARAETTYRFGAAGSVLIGCHLPGHWDHGMRGTIVVGA